MVENDERSLSQVEQGIFRIVMGVVFLVLTVGTGFAQKEKDSKLPLGCGDGQVAK